MHQGCLRPLLLSALLLLAGAVALVVVYFDTFELMVENMTAMGEGAAVAEEMRDPGDLLEWIAEHPGRVSLVAYDVLDPDAGVYFGADSLRPVVGLPRLLVLAGYAAAARAGRLDEAERVPLAAVRDRHLPGTDRRAHAAGLPFLRGRADADSTVALADVAEAMMRHNDRAATDYLLTRLPPAFVDALPDTLGLPALDAPLPEAGVFLSWGNHTLEATAADRLESYAGMERRAYTGLVRDLARTYATDVDFRDAERARRRTRGTDLSLRQQRELAAATFPRGTARAWAALLTDAVGDSLRLRGVSARLLAAMERPLPDTIEVPFTALGTEAGAFPGIVSLVAYARRRDAAAPRVVALLMDDVPISIFYHLGQTGLDQGLVLQLLADDTFLEQVRRRLLEAETVGR